MVETIWTPDQAKALETTLKVLNWISVGSALFVVITYIIFKRKYPTSMALYFSAGSCILPIFLLLGVTIGLEKVFMNRSLCILQGFGIQFFGSMIVWWFFFIAADLDLVIIQKKHVKEQRKMAKVFHLLGFGIPVFQSLLPLAFDLYQPAGLWCWIDDQTSHGLYEFLFFYGEMGTIAIIALFLWIRVIHAAFHASKVANMESAHMYLFRHILIVVIYILVFFVMFIHRLYIAIAKKDSFVLTLLHVAFLSSVGLVCFIVFGVSTNNFRLWRDLILSAKRKREYESLNT